MSYVYVIVEGNIYSNRIRESDPAFLISLREILADVPQRSLFNVLYHKHSSKWHLEEDIPYPYGDDREFRVFSSWVVDLDNNLVTLRKKDAKNYRIRLHKLLRMRCPSVADMKISKPLPLQQFTLDGDFGNPTWEPEFSIAPGRIAFIRKVLNDFVYQWRHVFRSQYNAVTFRKLACAIIRIATLDFNVKENPESLVRKGRVVRLSGLPPWKPISRSIIHFDLISIILCQHFAHAMTLIRDDCEERRQRHGPTDPSSGAPCLSITYLLLSIREVFLYKTCTCNSHTSVYTKPERLFNGVDRPSEQALAYLLAVTTLAPGSLSSPLHALPFELQDMILDNLSLSVGRVEAARIGCLLSLGTPFQWRSTEGITIHRQEYRVIRPQVVESQIWFDDDLTGLAYREKHLSICESHKGRQESS